jgi:hypothetical protein
LNFQTTYKIEDISDITVKRDTISKNVNIKHTKNNAQIFGNLFNQSRYVDSLSPESLRYNFSNNRPVECMVLENSELIVKGFLKVTNTTKQNGVVSYECLITGNIVNFYTLLNSDALLSDLDFSEYAHNYSVENIKASWLNTSGYVYPFINYGVLNSPKATEINNIHYSNWRPAIYFKEYLNKIFSMDVLKDFTYEIAGEPDFINEINTLIVPNDQEQFSQTAAGTVVVLTNTGTINNSNSLIGVGLLRRALNVNIVNDALNLIRENPAAERMDSFMWERNVKTDMKIGFNLSITNNNNSPVNLYVKLYVKDSFPSDGVINLTEFSVSAESFIKVVDGHTTYTSPVTFVVPEKVYAQGSMFTAVFHVEGANVSLTQDNVPFTITNFSLNASSSLQTPITYDVY